LTLNSAHREVSRFRARACTNNSPVGIAVGGQVDKPNRKLMIETRLADPAHGRPYTVWVLFARDDGKDGDLLNQKEKSLSAAVANFYEVYDVANYHISK
jgi:hypothetical protein